MLQAEDPEQCAAPGFSGGTAGSTSFSQGEDDGAGDDYFFGFGVDDGGVEDDDYDGCFRMEVDGDGGIGEGGEGDDNLSISVDQLLAFLDEPNDAPLEFEGGEAEAEDQGMLEMTAADDDDDATAGEQAQEQPCTSSPPPSTSLMEYLPSCSSTSNDIDATNTFPSHRVYMKAALHDQRPGLEGFLGAHEADTRLTEGPHIDINNYDCRNLFSSNNDDTHGLSPDCLRFSCPEYVSQCATGGSSIPSLSAPVSPPFSEFMSNSTLQLETTYGMENFGGYRDQDGTKIGTTCMPWSNPSSHRISYETDEDTKPSMNTVGVRKNGMRGHYMMPEEHGSAFSLYGNFANNGYQCSAGGTLHDLPHTNLDLTLSNMPSGKLYNGNDDVKLENSSCSVGKLVNGYSSTVPLQGVSLHSSDYLRQGAERASQSCESSSFFVKNEQGITSAASAESSPNHITEDEYLGGKHEYQSMPRMDFVPPKRYISESHMTAPQKNKCVDDDAEVQIWDDLNGPPSWSIPTPIKSLYKSKSGVPSYDHAEDFSLGSKACDEKLTYQIALQDLTQPLSESNPPDGVLAVPLLRHQRIALSWMVQKETSNQNCSGGILADDQGLGKTVSTIALILSERSPSFQSCEHAGKQVEVETLSSDDEDPQINDRNQTGNFERKKGKKSVVDNGSTLPLKGRPAAGTLVVCPTSVLRQWADEIQNKVTNKGKLSLLLYHGPNRTKDPSELAKYDVVLTTYSIVSMEVPKQVVDDKDDEDKAKHISDAPMGSSSSKKRKQNPSKVKTTADGKPVEVIARPLAKVAWFRVILDEAQTIKNHRTLVAKACCGLRAKRRWCLSGTPIQNSIDDLYSYFRFLRYDPYAIYSSFCSNIKLPINRNPAIGYRKLQAVLKTILLRRTKGTYLEGEPIIKLPPKSIELKRLDFSIDERKFYDNLEAESRAQFQAYADAGTVKENYVNILLMLLRLRQACDHPVLAHCSDSSVLPGETVKQLSREKCLHLLNCLEASQAICRICNDPPEDAVVSICGHVFCNQCVSEHLTGDIKHCPTTRCKVKLNATSVFTKASLKNSIDDLPRDDISTGSCVTQEISEQKTDVFSSASSKIKTAMEILLSLPILEQSSKHIATFDTSEFSAIKHETADIIQVNDMRECILRNGEAGCLHESQGLSSKRKEKALVFSQWTRMLDLLETQLKSSCIQYRRLDGTMSIADRDKAVKEFNTLPEVTVMILSLKAASLGLNLVSACHVLLLDLWWNPTTEDQAVDRAHRIGQTRPVTVMRLTVKDTVEDRILALQDKKREMVASAFGEDEKGSRQSRLTVDDLKYLFMM